MRLGPSQKAAGKEGQTEFPTFLRFHLSPKKLVLKQDFESKSKKALSSLRRRQRLHFVVLQPQKNSLLILLIFISFKSSVAADLIFSS